jgi:hypothetical protein
VLTDGSVRLANADEESGVALAHPMLIDQAYANRLPSLEFNVSRIIGYYAMRSQLGYVWSDMPPEFDLAEEFEQVRASFQDLHELSAELDHT